MTINIVYTYQQFNVNHEASKKGLLSVDHTSSERRMINIGTIEQMINTL